MENIIMQPIGFVRNAVEGKKHTDWGKDVSVIQLKDEFRGGLTGMEGFSHAIILFYLDKAKFIPEKHLKRHPRNRQDMPIVGIFPSAQRIAPIPSA